jgi:pSer/pThr/pTyr-binding forkhead associated (FHA) protein
MADQAKTKFQIVPDNIFLVVGPNLLPIEFPTTNIGRHVNNNVIINDPLVSRYHARILYRDKIFYIEDLGSTHGTMVNRQHTDSFYRQEHIPHLRNGARDKTPGRERREKNQNQGGFLKRYAA